MSGSFLGPSYTKNEIQKDLKLFEKFGNYSQDQMLKLHQNLYLKEKLLVGFKVEWNLVQERLEIDQ